MKMSCDIASESIKSCNSVDQSSITCVRNNDFDGNHEGMIDYVGT